MHAWASNVNFAHKKLHNKTHKYCPAGVQHPTLPYVWASYININIILALRADYTEREILFLLLQP